MPGKNLVFSLDNDCRVFFKKRAWTGKTSEYYNFQLLYYVKLNIEETNRSHTDRKIYVQNGCFKMAIFLENKMLWHYNSFLFLYTLGCTVRKKLNPQILKTKYYRFHSWIFKLYYTGCLALGFRIVLFRSTYTERMCTRVYTIL